MTRPRQREPREPVAPLGEGASLTTDKVNRAKGFVRGSSLLFLGRLISVGVNFLVQVLAVRYLEKSVFGAFSWASSIATMGSSFVLLGLNRGVAQMLPQHHERREYGALFGTMALAVATVAALGTLVIALVFGLRGLLVQHVESELSVGLLLILIGLVPLDALDALFETLMAVFARARSIFFRRYALAPALKLLAVLLVIAVKGSVQLLAAAYLIAGFLGVALYVVLLRQVLAEQGLLFDLDPARMSASPRRLFGISLPLLTTDLLLVIETPMVVVFLEHWRSTVEVAELRAVAPVAGLCLLVFQNSKILFRPQAARLLARGDEAGLGDLYWRSAAWMTVVTFPIFAVCAFLARPLTLMMFGPEYANASVLLVILAAGKYFNAALGMNTFTLQVHARVGLILIINALSALSGVGACFLLIPRHGAVGGAVATCAAVMIRNALYQAGLMATTRIGFIPRSALSTYVSVLVAVGVLSAIESMSGSVVVMVPTALAASVFLPWFNRRNLDIAGTFPELARVPLLRRLLWAAP